MVSSITNNGNAQISGSQLNVKSSSAKIRVPDPLLVSSALRGRTHTLRPLGRICPFIHDIKTADLGVKSLTSQQ